MLLYNDRKLLEKMSLNSLGKSNKGEFSRDIIFKRWKEVLDYMT